MSYEYVEELPSCCSVLSIGCFSDETTKEDIVRVITNYLEDYWDFDGDKLCEPPKFYMATTTKDQLPAIKALKELGFRQRKFAGRHAKSLADKYMILWTKVGIPRGILTTLKRNHK